MELSPLDDYEFLVTYETEAGRVYTIPFWAKDELDAWRKADEELNGKSENREDRSDT